MAGVTGAVEAAEVDGDVPQRRSPERWTSPLLAGAPPSAERTPRNQRICPHPAEHDDNPEEKPAPTRQG